VLLRLARAFNCSCLYDECRRFLAAASSLIPHAISHLLVSLPNHQRQMSRRWSRSAIALLAIPVMAGCRNQGPVDPAPAPSKAISPGHGRMLTRLEKIRRQAVSENPFFEQASITRDEVQLASLPPAGNGPELFRRHVSLARSFRRIGENMTAINHFSDAEESLKLPDVKLAADGQAPFLFDLGLTHLRIALKDNCIYCPTSDSSILPISEAGVLQKRDNAAVAAEFFRRAVGIQPDDLKSKWLMNVAAMLAGTFPDHVPQAHRLPDNAFRASSECPRFTDVAFAAAVRSVGCAGSVIADDFDGDGLIDLLIGNSDPSASLLYFRNTGLGTFAEDAKARGLAGFLGGNNLVQADYDNDGRVDVLVLRGAGLGEAGRQPVSLLKNGPQEFSDVTYDVGLGETESPTTAGAWADFDNDGDLDLYLTRETGPNSLFRNDGVAGFVDVAAGAGVTNDRTSVSASWGDYNADRFSDLYVANAEGGNRLYRNDGQGRFVDVAQELGLVGPSHGAIAWFWDVNNDGRLDVFAPSNDVGIEHTSAYYFGLPRTDEPDHLYLQREDGRFENVAEAFGLRAESQPRGGNFGDVDNDGFPDLYLATAAPGFESLMPNLMYRNRGGAGFDNVTFSGGFGHLQKGNGVAFADFDNDGDQDVFLQVGGLDAGDAFGSALFANPGFGNHWLRVRLVGEKSNRSAIGARIRADIIENEAKRSIYRWVNSGGSFGANPLAQQLGLGSAAKIDRLEVYWPTSDTTQHFENVPVDSQVEIHEGRADLKTIELKPFSFRSFNRIP
jgi:hypothetical protein